MADDETPLVNLSIHLIKDDRGDVDLILKKPDRLTKHDLNLGNGTACELYIKRPRSRPPKWANLFSEHVELRTFGRIASSAAVLVLTVKDRWFAITFGQGGRFLLDLDSVEERFGLLVVLNSIPENRVRSIDKTAFDPLATHSRVQTSREATPRDFGLDVETDLVKAVTGTPSDSALGHRLHGMDMLSATIRATVDEIPELLSLYYRQSRSKSYKKSFPWLDHIAEVKDIALRHRLDQLLLDRIHKEEYERCWLAVPELVDWDKVDGFRYGAQKRNARHHDIDIRDFVAELDEIAADGFEVSGIDLKLLLNRKVRCIGEDSILIHQ